MDIRDAFLSSPRRSVKLDSYFPVYEELFNRFKGKPITFVEIGVLGGGSLFMWRDFFGPEARIIGIDLNPEVKELEAHGFEIYLGDQADPKFWTSLEASIGKVDVILDDGGHRYDQQTITVEEGLSLLKDDGLLVVEDIFTSYQNGYGPKSLSFVSYVRSRIDALQMRYEANLQSSPRPEFRFWSIQIFQGIVAFHKRSEFSLEVGKVVDNHRPNDYVKDFRYQDTAFASKLDSLAYKLISLDRIPGLKSAYKAIRPLFLVDLRRKQRMLKKFFK